MFQMATKYRGRYWRPLESTPEQDALKKTEQLGQSLSRLAKHHIKSALGQIRTRIKELDSALSLQQRRW